MAYRSKSYEKRTTPQKERAIEIACLRLSCKALELLERCLTDPAVDMRYKVMAAKEILDRGLGRPRQKIDQKVTMEGGEGFMEALELAKKRAADAIAPVVTPVVETEVKVH